MYVSMIEACLRLIAFACECLRVCSMTSQASKTASLETKILKKPKKVLLGPFHISRAWRGKVVHKKKLKDNV